MISKIRTCLVAILAAATVVTSVPVYAADTKVDTNIETVENQPSDSEQIEENQVQNAIEQHLNYLYIESPYVETPATQRIVVSWGDGTENIEEIDLSVEHNGDTQTWTSVKSEDGVFLYEECICRWRGWNLYNNQIDSKDSRDGNKLFAVGSWNGSKIWC